MARFEVNHVEGTNYVDVHLDDEMIRAEAGALSYMTGDITIKSRLDSLDRRGDPLRSWRARPSIGPPTPAPA